MNALDDLRARLTRDAAPLVGREVVVWTVLLHKPYVRAPLLRVAAGGLVLAGYGVLPFDQIASVSAS